MKRPPNCRSSWPTPEETLQDLAQSLARSRAQRVVVYGDGDTVEVRTGGQAARFLLVSGRPLNEPIARGGPFVMNTRAEIEQALRDLHNGTFVWRPDQ